MIVQHVVADVVPYEHYMSLRMVAFGMKKMRSFLENPAPWLFSIKALGSVHEKSGCLAHLGLQVGE